MGGVGAPLGADGHRHASILTGEMKYSFRSRPQLPIGVAGVTAGVTAAPAAAAGGFRTRTLRAV